MLTASSKSASTVLALALIAGCKSDYELTGDRPDVDPGEVTECGFTGVEGTRISRYDCNPVFTTTGEPWAPTIGGTAFHTTEVLGHPFYQIWYVGQTAQYGSYQLGYAVSGDGTSWDTQPQNPLLGSEGGSTWDRDIMDAVQVVWDDSNNQYVATYQGARVGTNATSDPSFFGMGVLTSPDGVTWARHESNPVIDFAALTTANPCWPLSLEAGGGAYRSYLGASDPFYDPFSDLNCEDPLGLGVGYQCVPACELYSATATSLDNWQMGSAPTLRADQWYETKGVLAASIAELDGVQYLFYISFQHWVVAGGDIVTSDGHHFNMATSTDGGLTWVKDPSNPLDQLAMTDPIAVRSVGAQTVGRRIHFWIGDTYNDVGGDGVGYFILEPDLESTF